MICALLAAGINLVFPLIVRYIAIDLLQPARPAPTTSFLLIASALVVMTAEYYCNFYHLLWTCDGCQDGSGS